MAAVVGLLFAVRRPSISGAAEAARELWGPVASGGQRSLCSRSPGQRGRGRRDAQSRRRCGSHPRPRARSRSRLFVVPVPDVQPIHLLCQARRTLRPALSGIGSKCWFVGLGVTTIRPLWGSHLMLGSLMYHHRHSSAADPASQATAAGQGATCDCHAPSAQRPTRAGRQESSWQPARTGLGPAQEYVETGQHRQHVTHHMPSVGSAPK